MRAKAARTPTVAPMAEVWVEESLLSPAGGAVLALFATGGAAEVEGVVMAVTVMIEGWVGEGWWRVVEVEDLE